MHFGVTVLGNEDVCSPSMSKHDKTQQLAPKKPLDIFIVLPSPLKSFCPGFLGWASRNREWLFQGRGEVVWFGFCSAPSYRRDPPGQDLCAFSKEGPGQMLSGIVYINLSLG